MPNQPRTGAMTCLYAILAKLNGPNLGDRHFFEWLDNASIDYLKGANAELASLRTRLEEAEEFARILATWTCDCLADGDETCEESGAQDDDPGAWCLTCSARRFIARSTPSKEQDHE